jgi:hypothetical protein
MTTEKIFITVDDERIEATGSVLEQILLDRENAKQRQIAEASEAALKAEAKAALLERLGITEDEAKLLLA